MARTVPDRFPVDDFLAGDHVAICDYCSAPWPTSKLQRDGAGRLTCPHEGPGLDEVTLGLMEAQAAAELAIRRVRIAMGREPRQPSELRGLLPDLVVDWQPEKAALDAAGLVSRWVGFPRMLVAEPASGGSAPAVDAADSDFAGRASVSPTAFGGGNDRLKWTGLPFEDDDLPLLMVVAKMDDDDGATRVLIDAPPAFALKMAGGYFSAEFGPTPVTLTGPALDTDLHVLTLRYTSTGPQLRIDGEVVDDNATPLDFQYSGAPAGEYGLGCARPAAGSGSPWYGRYARVILARDSTAAEAAAAEAELMSLYGIAAA